MNWLDIVVATPEMVLVLLVIEVKTSVVVIRGTVAVRVTVLVPGGMGE